MQVVLVMFNGDGERRSFSLARDVTLIGRREDCDLRIPLGDVSRKHCRLIKKSDGLHAEDLGSSNGTFVNDQRIQESPVQAGDVLRIGPVNFVVQIDGAPPEDQIVPPATASAHLEDADVSQNRPAEPGDFDPMNTLNAPADSEVDFVLEEPGASDQSAIVDLEQLQAESEPQDEEEPH